jgi:hypothetical protein
MRHVRFVCVCLCASIPCTQGIREPVH